MRNIPAHLKQQWIAFLRGGFTSEEYIREKLRIVGEVFRLRYGLTLEQYDRLLLEQGSKCLICGRKTKKMCVDHCHRTKKIRGILCHKCNVGIGMLDDSPLRVSRALAYLLFHS